MTQIFLWLTVLLLSGSTGPPLDFQSIAPQLTPPTLTPVADVPASSQFIHSIETRPQSALEAGLFHDDFGDEYVVFVNRMCNNADGSPADPDTFWVHLSGDSTYLVEDVLISHQPRHGLLDGLFYAYGEDVTGMPAWQVILGPGEGRLFRLTPNVHGTIPGGVWRGSVTLTGTVVLPATENLLIDGQLIERVTVLLKDDCNFEVRGNLTANYTDFVSGEIGWERFDIVSTGQATYNVCTFDHANRTDVAALQLSPIGTVTLNNTVFNHYRTGIAAQGANLTINSCFFNGDIYGVGDLYDYGILVDGGKLRLHQTQFTQNAVGLWTQNPPDSTYDLQRNTFQNGGYGVWTYGGTLIEMTDGNTVMNNSYNGLMFQHGGAATIEQGGSDKEINQINDNGMVELYFDSDVSLDLANGKNEIWDDEYVPGNVDESIVYRNHPPGVPDQSRPLNFEMNSWGTDYGENRFQPGGYNRFDIFPIWQGSGDDIPPAKALYTQATIDFDDGYYELAETGFKQVVANYPDSEYALMSLQQLLMLEKQADQDFVALKTYYETQPNRDFDPVTSKVSEQMITYTHVAAADYATAIDRLETIVANPPSLADSVFAVIDLGWVYVLMQHSTSDTTANPQARVVGRYPELQPADLIDHRQRTLEIMSLLGMELPNPYQESIADMPSLLAPNFPNPFNPQTTIRYRMPQNSPVRVSIFNMAGQLVRTLVHKHQAAGDYDVTWDGRNDNGQKVGSGIYIYQLALPDRSESRRMVLLK